MALIRPITTDSTLVATRIETSSTSNAAYTYTSDGTYKYILVQANDSYANAITDVSVSNGAEIIIADTAAGSCDITLIKLVTGSSLTVTFRTDGAGITRNIWGLA